MKPQTQSLVKTFERRLRQARREVWRTIARTDEELTTLEAHQAGAAIEDAGTVSAADVLSRLDGTQRHRLDEIDAAQAAGRRHVRHVRALYAVDPAGAATRGAGDAAVPRVRACRRTRRVGLSRPAQGTDGGMGGPAPSTTSIRSRLADGRATDGQGRTAEGALMEMR